MEKKVYCNIGDRCKCIKFFSQKGINDVDIIRNRLQEASKTDIVLRRVLCNKDIILQRFDSDRNNKVCDIEDDEEIENKSEIKILLYDNSVHLKSESCTSPSSEILTDTSSEPYTIKILHTEPLNSTSSVELQTVENDTTEMMDITDANNETIQNIDIAIPSTSNDNDRYNHLATNIIEDITKTESQQSAYISYTAPLPALSYDLQEKLESYGILKAQRYLLPFWGQYLWQTTCKQPSKQDYSTLAYKIVTAYPQLAGGRHGTEIVRTQLSSWIRNHRCLLRKHGQKRTSVGKAVKVASIVETSSTLTDLDVKNALKELESKVMKRCNNMSHIKRLLKLTMSVRRQWIENESTGICEIVAKYPALEHYETILYEFLNIKGITEDVLFTRTSSMLDILMKYFSMEGSLSTSQLHIYTIEKLNDKLCNKKLKKKYTALFTVRKVLSSTAHLKGEKTDAPHIVIYLSQEGEIVEAYIVADETIKIKIPQPSVSKIIVGLLSVYYVWHVEYPTCYSYVLEYIDYKILQSPLKSQSTVVAKFIRECENTLHPCSY